MDSTGRQVRNTEQPPGVPVAPMGDVAVIVHLLWSDGSEEWRPARAVRWTRTHVMVGWRDEAVTGAGLGRRADRAGADHRPAARPAERWVWLRAGDVMRSVSWLVAPDRAAR